MCNRWVRVDNGWKGLYGTDAGRSGSWDSYDMCVEWRRY